MKYKIPAAGILLFLLSGPITNQLVGVPPQRIEICPSPQGDTCPQSPDPTVFLVPHVGDAEMEKYVDGPQKTHTEVRWGVGLIGMVIAGIGLYVNRRLG